MSVISPVAYCPPIPEVGPAREFARFRRVRRYEVRQGVEVYRPRFLVAPGQRLRSKEAVLMYYGIRRTVARLHARRPFDLVHAHFSYPEGAAALRVAEEHGLPLVVTELAPWKPWLSREHEVRRQAVEVARRAKCTMALSRYVEQDIRTYAGTSANIEVVPLGVDGAVFRPLEDRARVPGQILFVGLVNFMKGLDVLLEAMRSVIERRPDAKLVLVGGAHYRDTRKQGERIRALATRQPLASHVSFAGPKPPDEVAQVMAESQVLVVSSRMETFSAVAVEALASGTPVVSTRCGGPEDILTTDDVGRLVPVEDSAALADAIVFVLDNPACFPAGHLRAHALENFSWDRVTARIAGVYRDSLDRARP